MPMMFIHRQRLPLPSRALRRNHHRRILQRLHQFMPPSKRTLPTMPDGTPTTNGGSTKTRLKSHIIRYKENTDFDFTESGSIRVVLYAKFTQGELEIETTNERVPSPSPSQRACCSCRMPSAPTATASTTSTRRRTATRASPTFMATSSTDGDRNSSSDPSCRRMGRHLQGQAGEGWCLFLPRQGKGCRRQDVQHQERCEPAARIHRNTKQIQDNDLISAMKFHFRRKIRA